LITAADASSVCAGALAAQSRERRGHSIVGRLEGVCKRHERRALPEARAVSPSASTVPPMAAALASPPFLAFSITGHASAVWD
jgi:hypothetical protein